MPQLLFFNGNLSVAGKRSSWGGRFFLQCLIACGEQPGIQAGLHCLIACGEQPGMQASLQCLIACGEQP